jgi:hypothetical protein
MNTPSTSTFVLAVLALASFANAQETASLDEAQKAARKVNAALPTLTRAPLAIDADLDKPHLVKGDGRGVLIVPDRRLTAEALANPGPAITPVGQLWMLKAGLARGGRPMPADELRTVKVSDGENDRDVQVYLLGVRKNEQGAVELVVFAKGNQPLLAAPLAADPAATQALPLEMTGNKTSEDTATLVIHLFGRQRAELNLMKSE